MAPDQDSAAQEAESTLRRYLGIDFPPGTEFTTLRHSWDGRRLIAWVFRWPGTEPMPRRPLPLCELRSATGGRLCVVTLARHDFGLAGEQMRRMGALLTTIPVYCGATEWLGLPAGSDWAAQVLVALRSSLEWPGGAGQAGAKLPAEGVSDYRPWLERDPDLQRELALIGASEQFREARAREALLLAESRYLDASAATTSEKIRFVEQRLWHPGEHPLAVVTPEPRVVIAHGTQAAAWLQERRDGALVALVSRACWQWRVVYSAGAVYVPIEAAELDGPTWVANSDAVLRAASISSAWRDDPTVPVAARSAANFVDRMGAKCPPGALLDAWHLVDDSGVVAFRLLPTYVPWMAAVYSPWVGRNDGGRHDLPSVIAIHAGWSDMADWGMEFLDRGSGSDRRQWVDRLVRGDI